ncbi:MAG: hypothetical protein ACFE9L_03310 [Candidatus Hodarchaeota archaeon]
MVDASKELALSLILVILISVIGGTFVALFIIRERGRDTYEFQFPKEY